MAYKRSGVDAMSMTTDTASLMCEILALSAPGARIQDLLGVSSQVRLSAACSPRGNSCWGLVWAWIWDERLGGASFGLVGEY